jgi:hypothetical protein
VVKPVAIHFDLTAVLAHPIYVNHTGAIQDATRGSSMKKNPEFS